MNVDVPITREQEKTRIDPTDSPKNVGTFTESFVETSPRSAVFILDPSRTTKTMSSSIMRPSTTPRKQKKKRQLEKDVAPLYKEDIGTEGVKPVGMAPQHTLQSFRLKVDDEEKSKRRKRMVRRGM
jgi:hypothetical protein